EMPEAAEAEVEGEAADVEVEGEAAEAETEGGGRVVKAAGLAALVAGVAAVVDRNNSSIAELEAQIDGLTQEKAGLDAVLAEKEQELAGYNDYSLNLQGQVNELAAQVAGVEAALAVKEQAEAEAQAQIEALNAQIETLNTEIADLQTQLDAVTSARADLEQTLQATQAQLEAAQAELAQIEQESQGVLGDRAVGLGAVGASVAAVSALKEKDAELADLRSQLEALQEQKASMAEESAALQTQLVAMEDDLGEVDAQRSAGLSIDAATTFSQALAKLPAIKSHAASAAIVAGAQPVLSPRIQALTDVKGIGSVYQQRLYRAGVGTYWELASLPDSDMQETLQIPELQRQRVDFEETRANAYELAKETGTVGLLWDGDHVDDFEPMPGIGKTFEKRLYDAGITTYEQLAACDVERLAEIIRPPAMREVNYDDLKERARQLIAERNANQPVEQDQPAE
ncbi:MAG TPA: helix-hairpin-helix domain-containing protein, partial [Anaerolineae bacterium]|nr:helix-hairpin-helix domain-containing protein [Anaerolineae bacterium]